VYKEAGGVEYLLTLPKNPGPSQSGTGAGWWSSSGVVHAGGARSCCKSPGLAAGQHHGMRRAAAGCGSPASAAVLGRSGWVRPQASVMVLCHHGPLRLSQDMSPLRSRRHGCSGPACISLAARASLQPAERLQEPLARLSPCPLGLHSGAAVCVVKMPGVLQKSNCPSCQGCSTGFLPALPNVLPNSESC